MVHRSISSVLVLIALVVSAGCSDAAGEITATEIPAGQDVQRLLAQNQQNAGYLERMRGEVEPNIVFDANGAWHVKESAVLSDEAQAFVAISQAHTQYVTAPASSSPGLALAAKANGSGCFYWGCRIAVSHGVWEGVKDACRPGRASGVACSRAIKGFIGTLGLTGWSATLAPWVIPAYWLVMDYACWGSGHRGFYINVTWALVTVISPM